MLGTEGMGEIVRTSAAAGGADGTASLARAHRRCSPAELAYLPRKPAPRSPSVLQPQAAEPATGPAPACPTMVCHPVPVVPGH
jgi:hypothetical protein